MNALSADVRTPLEWASLNNAIWCDTVCRAHGVPGEFSGGVWLNRHLPPPYHSKLVTLRGAAEAARSLAQVQALLRLPLPQPQRWTVKASACELDLAPLGFEPLFDAEWIWREPAGPVRAGRRNGGWSRIADASLLAAFNHAWSADGTDPNMRGRAPQFPPSLLDDPDVAFLALHDGGRWLGGGIANRTGPVIGLSNTFGLDETSAEFWAGLVQAAQEAFPGLPLAGYERGTSLNAAFSAGFVGVGPLRVWIRRA